MKLEKPITRKILIITSVLFWLMVMGASGPLHGESVKDIYLAGLKAGQQKDIEGAESYFIKALAADLFYIPARRSLFPMIIKKPLFPRFPGEFHYLLTREVSFLCP